MLSLFIPVYNAENVLEENVIKVYNYLNKLKYKFEIIIIDDNSNDKTLEKIKLLCNKFNKIRYIHYDNGPSRRENLGMSFEKAKGDVVAFMDVDLSADLNYMNQLVNKINEGHDIAIGSRYKGEKCRRSISRLLISKIYNFIMQKIFGSKLTDHQCGFKAFNKKKLLELLKQICYDNSYNRGWFWDAELLILAQKKNYSVIEVPVKWNASNTSTFNIKREIRMIGYIIKNFRRIRSGRY